MALVAAPLNCPITIPLEPWPFAWEWFFVVSGCSREFRYLVSGNIKLKKKILAALRLDTAVSMKASRIKDSWLSSYHV